jgi:hypothetical protein
MKRFFSTALLILSVTIYCWSQDYNRITDDGTITPANQRNNQRKDSLQGKNKEIPRGIKVWTVDERFGDRSNLSDPDTIQHMFMNTIFTTGLRGEYNTTGNLGSPRINRIFTDRPETEQFMFTQPYSYFITPVNEFKFTNTYSPITNITYNNCGDRTDGEDHLTALFAVNAGKRIGVGFKFDYIYGRGYYQNQSTALFDYSMYGSYIGDRYQAHLLFSTNHQKMSENGGITNDKYITNPETFNDNYQTSEIPTVLERNWNRNDNQHIFFTQRYNLGFNRKVPMTKEEIKAKKFALESKKEAEERKKKDDAEKQSKREGRKFNDKDYKEEKQPLGRPDNAKIAGYEPNDTALTNKGGRISVNGKADADSLMANNKKNEEDTSWLKNEYVPVTSFIHTLKFDTYKRIYQAYETPTSFYANTYNIDEKLSGDSIYDNTTHYSLKNTFAIALLEGFNKWAKAGLKAFITSDLRHFALPDSANGMDTYNEHNLSIGGQLSKTKGTLLHYNFLAETWLTGPDAGQIKINGSADLNFRLFNDTVTLAANAYIYHLNPTFYFRHYHSKHFWWDDDNMDKEFRTHIEGILSYKKTNTTLRLAIDDIKNYTYLSESYAVAADFTRNSNTVNVRQCSSNISLLTASLYQNFKLGILNWENCVTYQKSSNISVIPVPDINIYSNLYIHFLIAHVLSCDLGADVRYFTKYYAPEYSPALGQYAVQENESSKVEIGNYPIVNAYANFHLKHTRFFIMMSHINAGSGDRRYFLTPHYPLNDRILRFGVSWNFFN